MRNLLADLLADVDGQFEDALLVAAWADAKVVGMAASVCAKDNLLPRELCSSRFDKLKTLMTTGVPPVIYHSGGGNCDVESFHFKEIGHTRLFPRRDEEKLADPNVKWRIDALKVDLKKR